MDRLIIFQKGEISMEYTKPIYEVEANNGELSVQPNIIPIVAIVVGVVLVGGITGCTPTQVY